MSVQVAPSMLACDFTQLGEEAKRAEAAGADLLHLDVMDGHFVPNLSMGPAIVAAINRSVDLFLDVHLMIYNPYEYIEQFVEAGADRVTFHFEATENVEETLLYIQRCGVQAGLAFSPDTPISFLSKYVEVADLFLVMTVHPGFGGQSFMNDMLEKVRFAREQIVDRPITLQVDGGINQESAAQCVAAGADCLVAGTYLFEMEEMAEGIAELHRL